MASSGLHSNGYSLVRHVLLDQAGWALDREVPELGRTLGEELLEPTRIYALDCLALARDPQIGAQVHAMAHVTGGGFAANLARVVPSGVHVRIRRETWSPGPVFGLVAQVGRVAQPELEATLNLGVGMAAVVAPEVADRAVELLAGRRVPAWVAGEVEAAEAEQGPGTVSLEGTYAG
jgi:phosphoribosylformylglycinamidine cyclo-ligase